MSEIKNKDEIKTNPEVSILIYTKDAQGWEGLGGRLRLMAQNNCCCKQQDETMICR